MACHTNQPTPLVEDDFGDSSHVQWDMLNSYPERPPGRGVLLKSREGADLPSRISTSLAKKRESRIVAISADVCCTQNGSKVRIWAAVSRRGTVSYMALGSTLAPSGDGHSRISSLLPIPEDASEVRIGVLNSSGQDIHVFNFKAVELPTVRETTVDPQLRELESLLLTRSIYTHGYGDKEKLAISGFVRLLSRLVQLGGDRTEATQVLIQYAGDPHSQVLTDTNIHERIINTSHGVKWSQVLDVGYLYLPGLFESDSHAEDSYIQTVLAALNYFDEHQTKTLLIDLRDNTGGNMWPMLCGLNKLLPHAFGSFDNAKGTETQWSETLQDWSADSGVKRCKKNSSKFKSKKIIVAISGRTASSGEAVAIALGFNANTVIVGKPSSGLTSGNEIVKLSDGTVIALASTFMKGKSRFSLGESIAPEYSVDDPGRGELTDDQIIFFVGRGG